MLFIFDMGGVVASSSCTATICKEIGISLHDFYSFQLDSEGNNTYQYLSVGSISVDEYWRNFSLNSKIEIIEDLFEVLYRPEINDALILLIENLKRKGHRVVCCTNTIGSHFEVHRRLGNYEIFDFVYSSHLMGVKKPSLEFFEKVIDVERVSAKDIYFIDDDERNVEAGQSVGMKTHLFISVESLKNALAEFLI
ncbi:HAD-IA family hydrolase [Pseudomonas sp. 148P]|uniref:HAD-IA family hydrolase n=1 Tax=Pseudomonas ulcerans TaxID=3115852 RepID=A0ABU7HJG0_9PSED|nr:MULTISPECIES: HAD-IA family hydrolase [unclassified Pseudomonas]MEE1921386.1 HAD-IA family hydrolase [Pseudomonas sp. 147P]MEE1931669.1 HAD-IA family hydrolase [Pseudomonas sp. 148P]